MQRKIKNHHAVQTGEGFFEDLGEGLKKAYNFAKDTKVISKGLGLIQHPIAQAASVAAGLIGLGKRRKHKKKTMSDVPKVKKAKKSLTNFKGYTAKNGRLITASGLYGTGDHKVLHL